MARVDHWLESEGLDLLAGWCREGFNLEEIAEKMGTKPKTIKSRIHEGKKKLEKRIKRGGNAYG